jgi:hypothetical protein
MARRRNTGAASKSGLTPPPRNLCGALQALMDDVDRSRWVRWDKYRQ